MNMQKQRKINTPDELMDWCDNNIPEFVECLAHGCDYAANWMHQMQEFERLDTQESYTAYIASILLYVAYHKPHLLGKEYQWAVESERVKKRDGRMLQ